MTHFPNINIFFEIQSKAFYHDQFNLQLEYSDNKLINYKVKEFVKNNFDIKSACSTEQGQPINKHLIKHNIYFIHNQLSAVNPMELGQRAV